MLYVSPVNNHAMIVTKLNLRDGGLGKMYQLFETLGVGDKLYSLAKETPDFDEAMRWLGIGTYDYKTTIMIEEGHNG